jgi:hypothetical protein
MRASVARIGILATSSWLEEDGVGDEQPIAGLGALRVSERLFVWWAERLGKKERKMLAEHQRITRHLAGRTTPHSGAQGICA